MEMFARDQMKLHVCLLSMFACYPCLLVIMLEIFARDQVQFQVGL